MVKDNGMPYPERRFLADYMARKFMDGSYQ